MLRYINKNGIKTLLGIVSILILTLSSFSLAQLKLEVSSAPVTSLNIGELDFKTFGSNNWLFTLTILYPGDHKNIQLSGDINVVLSDGTSINNPAATMVTESFEVVDQKTITNLNLGSKAEIKMKEFQYSQEARDKIQNLALGTGKLPAGIYTFHLVVTDLDNPGQTDFKDVIFNLENVSRLDLVLPEDESQVPTQFPLFQWRYDGTDVQLSVYEKHSNQQSRDEAATGVPQLQITSGSPGFPSGSKSFQYPAVGARPLEVGKSYVWKVVGLTSGTGGVGRTIPSEIWEFTVSGDNKEDHHSDIQEDLTFLTGIGTDILNQLINGDLTPTGKMFIDGRVIPTVEGEELLKNLNANPDRIVEIELVPSTQ